MAGLHKAELEELKGLEYETGEDKQKQDVLRRMHSFTSSSLFPTL